MDLLSNFQQFIKSEKLFRQQDRLLVAVSAGVDSIVLCELCSRSGYSFAIAHCNFQLRGEESDQDEAFVVAFAKKYKAEVFVNHFDTESYAKENKLSIQVAARELRYDWFHTIADPTTNTPFNFILTAHHADDNIETLLINFFKGTGIGGLQGIQPKTGKAGEIIRPLLFARKEELYSFAEENGLQYREDSSNESNKYTRNFFRNQVIPSLKDYFPQVENNLLDNIKRFADVNILYRNSIDALRKKNIIDNKGTLQLPVLKLLKTPALPTVIFELTREFNFTGKQAADIIKLLHSESGKYIDSSTHRILRNRKWLMISKFGDIQQSLYLIEEPVGGVDFAEQKLVVERMVNPGKINPSKHIAQLDADVIYFPFLLRKWKKGDYFYPLGMQKKKKLSRFFIDIKLSLIDKENTWVIEMDKKIIWVVGQRIDDRFKVSEQTKEIIRFTLTSS